MTQKRIVFWPYSFGDMKASWARQAQWIAKAFHACGYAVYQHEGFKCKLPNAQPHCPGNAYDIAIYNHATKSDLIGPVVSAERSLFFKPTIPDEYHTTLDEMGYGAYSSITYDKPAYEQHACTAAFRGQMTDWKTNLASKWGKQFTPVEVVDDDYYLVIGQVPDDFTVHSMAFGDYERELEIQTEALATVSRTVTARNGPGLA